MAGATIPVAPPVAALPGSSGQGAPPIAGYTASAHCKVDDIVALAGGEIAPAAANAAGSIAGIAQGDSVAVFQQDDTGLQGVFGADNVNTGLLPAGPGLTRVATLGAPVVVEISLTPTTGWVSGGSQQADIGTAVGLAIDGGTGFYLADPTASNKVAVIDSKVEGPGKGGEGDLGGRVRVVFNAAALAVQQGQ